MGLTLLQVFQSQILVQCELALMATDEIGPAARGRERKRLFFAIQNLLNAAANIAKLLWGQGGQLATERQALRDSIGISDDSPLHEVAMRNNFEHMDERLDRWYQETTQHNFADLNIGGPAGFLDDIDQFRQFNPKTGDVVFWGQGFNLITLTREIRRILPRLREVAEKPLAEPKP